MKFFSIISFLAFNSFWFYQTTFAQLPKNDLGKVAFTEIVKDSLVLSMIMFTNAEQWLSKNFKSKEMSIVQDSTGGSLKSQGSFMVYNKGIVSKEPHGRIRFNVQLDIKTNKYRYSFTDFVFEYYKINREYKFVPTGKEKPLEDTKASGWQKLWNKHKGTTNKEIQNHISSLKSAMQRTGAPQKVESKKEEW